MANNPSEASLLTDDTGKVLPNQSYDQANNRFVATGVVGPTRYTIPASEFTGQGTFVVTFPNALHRNAIKRTIQYGRSIISDSTGAALSFSTIQIGTSDSVVDGDTDLANGITGNYVGVSDPGAKFYGVVNSDNQNVLASTGDTLHVLIQTGTTTQGVTGEWVFYVTEILA